MGKIDRISYKKIVVYAIIFLLITTHSIYTYGARNFSLSDFVKNNNVANLSNTQIQNKLNSIKFENPDMKSQAIQEKDGIIGKLNGMSAKDKLTYLDNEFKTRLETYNNGIDNDAEYNKYIKPLYEYLGYSLGYQRVLAQKAQEAEKETEGLSQDDLQKKFNNTYNECKAYINKNEQIKQSQDYRNKLQTYYDRLTTINNQITNKSKKKDNQKKIDEIGEILSKIDVEQRKDEDDKNNEDKKQQELIDYEKNLGQSSASADHSVDEVINEAKNFMTKGDASKIGFNSGNLKKGSDTLFNILLMLGIAGTVIAGIYLGIKFMLSSAEDKAKVKESLVPYFAGCIVIYGAFTIWKLVIVILGGL